MICNPSQTRSTVKEPSIVQIPDHDSILVLYRIHHSRDHAEYPRNQKSPLEAPFPNHKRAPKTVTHSLDQNV